MTKEELSKIIHDHKFTDEEKQEAKEIVDILQNEGFDMVGDFTYEGEQITSRSIGFDGAYRYITVVAIQKETGYGFNYYIIETGGHNYVQITDFQEKWLPKFEARCEKEFGYPAIPFDCLLYFLINIKLDSGQRDNAETMVYVLHKSYCLKATLDEKTQKYRLKPIHGYGCGMAMDEVLQYGCHFMEPVFEYIECPSCNHNWMFDESRIPAGEKYDTPCPMCGTLLMRRK